MKLAGFIILTALLHVSLSGATQTVNFSGKDLPLKKIFSVIKTQTGVFFFYDATLVGYAKPVTIEWNSVSLETALNETFRDQPLTWALEDKTVTIIRRPFQISPTDEPSLRSPPPMRVKGSITDQDGNTLTGASVMIKGTEQGTVSDGGGGFSIIAEQNNVLVISSVNYSNKEVRVENREMNIKLQLDIKPMEASLVGGNLTAIKRKADATSVTILDSKTLEKIPENTLDQVFRGWVPGTTSFDAGDQPEGVPTLSIRGAGGPNSLTPIAVYIDGIEYAGGSGYLSQLDKSGIDRIEIVRGPGAATMYGTGSNGGIVQIFTKKTKGDQNTFNFRSSAGFYKSKWVEKDPFQQMHNLETITTFKNLVVKLGGSYRTIDAYLPDGGEKNKGIYGSAGFNVGKLQATLSGRYNVRNYHLSRKPYYDTAMNPQKDIIIEPVPGFETPAYLWFNVMPTNSRNKDALTETLINALNLSHQTTKNWINRLDAGYTMNNSTEIPKQDGMAILQKQYRSDRYKITTIRYSNLLSVLKRGNGIDMTISSGAEYKKYSAITSHPGPAATTHLKARDPDNENYGAFVQANPSYKNVYLTLGLRYEKNNLFRGAWNPRIGITTNFESASMTIKPRISWGKGISSPSYQQRFGRSPTMFTIIYPNPHLKPQSQQGFDYGVEVYDKKGKFKFEAVYYDNLLQNMIARETQGPDPVNPMLSGSMYANVGEVTNRGWEFSGDLKIKQFSLKGTFSIMNSIIRDTTGAYNIGPLKNIPPGTRMPNLPRHTAGLNLNYNFTKLIGKADKGVVSLNITEVDGVMFLDFRNYAIDVAYGRTVFNPDNMGYLVETSPVFRVGLYADYHLTSELRFFIQGSNILNSYKYEYSNEYPTHGSGWLFGFNYSVSKSKNIKKQTE